MDYSYFENFMKINLIFNLKQEEKKRTRKMLSMENIDENIEYSLSQQFQNNNNRLQRVNSNETNEITIAESSIQYNNNNDNDIDIDDDTDTNTTTTTDNNINKIKKMQLIQLKELQNQLFNQKNEIMENETISIEKSNNHDKSLQKLFFQLSESEKLLKEQQTIDVKKNNNNSQIVGVNNSGSISQLHYSMTSLPQEIIFHIFQFLDVNSLNKISSTNSLLGLIGNDNELWKKMSITRFGCSSKLPKPYFPLWKNYFKAFRTYKGHWDPIKKGKIFITNNNKTITHAGDYLGSYQSARGSEPISEGIVYWEFYINTLSANQTGFHLVVGVVPESFSIWHTYLTSGNGWGYLADGRKANNSGNGVTYASSFVQDSTIGCLLDMNQKTLSFYHNGVFQGVAFDNIEGTVYPGVSLLTGGQSVSFVTDPVFPEKQPQHL